MLRVEAVAVSAVCAGRVRVFIRCVPCCTLCFVELQLVVPLCFPLVFARQSFLVVFLSSCCSLLCVKRKGKTNESSLLAAGDSAVLGSQICDLFIVCKILLGSSCVLDRKHGPSSHCIV